MEITSISFIVSGVSLAIFIFVEKRTKIPLIELWLLKDRILLPSYIMMIITGTTIFLVYPTIVQLVRSPQPSGFGGDALYAAFLQLPFMIVFLIFSGATPVKTTTSPRYMVGSMEPESTITMGLRVCKSKPKIV